MKTRNALNSLAAVAVAGILIACSSGDPKSSPADSSSQKPAAAGASSAAGAKPGVATVAAGTAVNVTTGSGDQLTVTIASPQAKVSSGNEYISPKKGQFFVVTATVQFTKGTSTYFANPGDFKLVTADGTVYEAEFLTTIEPTFTSTQLNPGQKTTGKVAFDVPADVAAGKGAKVQFTGSWDGKAAAYWTI